MIERNDFNSIEGISLKFRKPNPVNSLECDDYRKGYVYLVRIDNQKIVAQIHEDDLFDENGNRFEF